jgi:3-dehydroquinate synthase
VPSPFELHVQRVQVQFEYPVAFTHGCLAPANLALRDAIAAREPGRRHRVLGVIDGGLANARPSIADELERYLHGHGQALTLAAAPRVIAGGESAKNDPAVLTSLLQWLHDCKMDRHACVIAVGGGALLDVVGYASAITHRGVRLVRVPTTVLAQADSGVGVKNGINAFGKKNFLGTFAPPYAVVNDFDLLETLSARDRVAGMAEAVKVALVRDAQFFDFIEAHAPALLRGDGAALAQLVRRSAELHMEHIRAGGDPFEHGSARPLDYGHWSAHKLEAMTCFRLRHGECVAIGMALDALYSAAIGLCTQADAERVLTVLRMLGLPLWDDALLLRTGDSPRSARDVLSGLSEFREHLGGDLTVTLLAGIGHGTEVHEMREPLIEACIDALLQRGAA